MKPEASAARMRVLILCTNSDEAGAPVHVETLINRLKDSSKFLAVFGEEGPVADRLRRSGTAVEIIPEMRSAISPVKDIRALQRLVAITQSFEPDIIHCHSSKAGMLGRLVAARFGIASVYTVHGWGWRGLGPFGFFAVWFIEKCLSYLPGTGYVFVSKSVECDASRTLGLRTPRSKVIYNGVEDLQVAPSVESQLTIFMAARVSDAKDHESLVRAFEVSPKASSLILCGTGTDTDSFRRSVKEWAPRRAIDVKCLGQRSDVPQLLRQCHIFALISNYEALPISIIEAMSAGKAIIASEVGGVSELLINGVSGLLVKKGDVAAIAACIDQLGAPARRRTLGIQARRSYEDRFTASKMASAVLDLYHKATIKWQQ